MTDLKRFCIGQDKSIRDTFKQMDRSGKKFTLVQDEEEMIVGIVTEGDLRRAIWAATSLDRNILVITNRDYVHFPQNYDADEVRQIFDQTNIRQIPIVQEGKLIDIVYRDELESQVKSALPQKIDMSVLIMAGGKGTRLDPFTKILPKALIPVGDKPIIEIIINNFQAYGINQYFVSVNHKANMIQAFFDDYHEGLKLSFIQEEKPLGTVGSLKLMPMDRDKTIIVTNCDIIIKHDYSTIARFHKQENYDITIVASMRHYKIPYGVCELTNGADLIDIKEKPEYDFLVNTGMYIVEPHMLDYIPENEYFDMTDLIKKAKQRNHKIGVYPISEKSWIDIGQWEQYHEAVKEL